MKIHNNLKRDIGASFRVDKNMGPNDLKFPFNSVLHIKLFPELYFPYQWAPKILKEIFAVECRHGAYRVECSDGVSIS